jgi:hypothetical protein
MHRSLSLRYLLFKTLLIPIIRVFSPRAESATFLFATMSYVAQAMRTFRRIRQYLEPHFVVQTFDKFSEMSACLGQRYPHLDAARYCSENSTIAR